MDHREIEDAVPEPTPEELERVNRLLRSVGGPSVAWGAASVLEVLVVEQRMKAERLASARLTRATWALALATVVLAASTVGLIIATLVD